MLNKILRHVYWRFQKPHKKLTIKKLGKLRKPQLKIFTGKVTGVL